MKDNYLTLKNKDGIKEEYRILLNIEDTTRGVNYVVYTDEFKNEDGSLRVYASSYVLSDKGNMSKLKPIKLKEEFDFIEKILSSLEGSN